MKARKARMEETEAIADLADDLVSRNEQLKTALEACKALQGRILAADKLAEALSAVLDTPEAVYPFSLTATFIKALEQARTALAAWQEPS